VSTPTKTAVPGERPTPARGARSGPRFGPRPGRIHGRPVGWRSRWTSVVRGRRLLRTMRPQQPLIIATLMLAVASVALAVVGPKILGHAPTSSLPGC